MYKVLIVEDEMLVRLGLKNSIEWSKFDMQVIADVPDGKAAMEVYERDRPDLVITDLKMPVMGGMELIEKIREKDNETRIIILSCIEEFDLVRKAMSLGVSNYILKLTITEEETEAVLKKAEAELNKIRGSGSAKLSLNHNMIKEELLRKFLFYDDYSADEFEVHASKLKLRINKTRLILCIMEISYFELLQTRFWDEKGQRIKLSISSILDELTGNFNRGEAFHDDDDVHYILIFSFNDIYSEQVLHQELYKILNNIKSTLNTFFDAFVCFGISSVQDGYASLKGMYMEALKSLKQKFFSGTRVFLLPDSQGFDGKIPEKLEALRHITILTNLLDNTGINEYNKKIDMIISYIPENSEQFREFFIELLQWMVTSLHLKGDNPNRPVVSYIHKILQSETLDDIIQIYKRFIFEITQNGKKNWALSREVSEAVKFIRTNYDKDINLHQIAKHVKISPTYLGNLFKKELQITFVGYLNELRVEKAKELLLETYLKLYEIAEKVGFSDDTYFSKVFKKIAGASPNKFRRQMIKEWTKDVENENN